MDRCRTTIRGWCTVMGVIGVLLAACGPPLPSPSPSPAPTVTPGPTVTPLPGQSIPVLPTDSAGTPYVSLPDGSPPAFESPLFPVPTRLPTVAATPTLDCAEVFPPEVVLRVAREELTVAQAIAAFGPVVSTSGRPPRLRFEESGCVLLLTAGVQTVQAAELRPYFTLDELMTRYGEPSAVVTIPASIRLPGRDRLAFLYPEIGLIALFERPPADRDSLIPQVQIVRAADLDTMLAGLGAGVVPVSWTPPPLSVR